MSILAVCVIVLAQPNLSHLRIFEEPDWVSFPGSAATPYPIDVVFQQFEHGSMIWRSDKNCVYALAENTPQRIVIPLEIPQEKRGQGYGYCLMLDPLVERPFIGAPPEGRFLPQGAIGYVWRYYTEIETSLGYATAPEIPYTATVPRNEEIVSDGATYNWPQLTLPNGSILKCGSRGATSGSCIIVQPESGS